MLEAFRDRTLGLTRGICSRLPRAISPNMLSAASLGCGLWAGIEFFRGNFPAGSALIAGTALLDLMDGELARLRGVSSRGDLLDHVCDRYADIAIICGPVLGGSVGWKLGLITLAGVLMVSYLGSYAQALGLGRLYSGFISRSDRLLLLFLGGILIWVWPGMIWGLNPLSWIFLIIGLGSHFTAIQRFMLIWSRLKE